MMHRIESEIIGANRKGPAILGNICGLPAQADARNQRSPVSNSDKNVVVIVIKYIKE